MVAVFHVISFALKYRYTFLISSLFTLTVSADFFSHEDNLRPYNQKISGSELSIEMVPIHGGQFFAGSSPDEIGHHTDEGPRHLVEVSDFWMSSLEISWDLYELFLYRDIDQHQAKERGEIEMAVDGVTAATMPYVNFNKPGHPVVNLTEHAASTFCKWLTAKTGHFYRLPTEAEWEYACRAESDAAFSFGNSPDLLVEYGWYEKNSNRTFHPGGQRNPNPWGLYDMHGNVAEWVIDSYDTDYYSTLASGIKDPVLFSQTLYPRVVRGGSWMGLAQDLRCASRNYSSKDWKKRDPQFPKSLWWMTDATHVGFRIVRPKKMYNQSEMEAYWGQPIEEY